MTMGRERARERASERGRRDVSGRGEQKENVCTARRPPRRLLRAASRSSGRVSALATLPCPVCHHRHTDKHHPCFYI